MKSQLIILFTYFTMQLAAQPTNYDAENAHSHNDYEQAHPFWEAWQNGFGSIEADIFLKDGNLIVAHDLKELQYNRSLDSLYLQPLQQCLQKNNGFPYTDKSKQLQLMIDVKSDSVNTLNELINLLKNYPVIIQCKKIKVTISGNRPSPEKFISYPSYIYFDGVLSKDYSKEALSKIAMLSDNFRFYSSWNGDASINKKDFQILLDAVEKAHALKKKVRFWNAPDNATAWQSFMRLKADYINTDHIKELAVFLKDADKKLQ